jgi:dTDP-4-dehydrorhamnose reductase
MKIVVLGYTGMLGRYVSKYFQSSDNIINLSRKDIDATNIKKNELRAKLFHLGINSGDVIINCIGMIKQRSDTSDLDFIQVNSVFPLMLADVCEEENIKLIHPTTDCVYDGLVGKYDENSEHTAKDVYGKSKSLGEPKNATTIRTSIIGDEIDNKKSLVEWVKSNKDKTVFGYTNHHWNGVTCLQFAKICEDIIEGDLFWNGVRHIVSPTTVTKDELVTMISDIYDLNITVEPKETDILCDRSLNSIYFPNVDIPELYKQIQEMKDFYEKLTIK